MRCQAFNNSKLCQCVYKTLPYKTFCGHHRPFDSDPECSICYENIAHSQMNKLPCGHIFHKMCIINWENQYKNTCPLCRKNFKKDKFHIDSIYDLIIIMGLLRAIQIDTEHSGPLSHSTEVSTSVLEHGHIRDSNS